MSIQVVNPRGIPEKCPGCGISPVKTKVTNYDPMWHDGNVVCADCGHFIRNYDADI